MPIDEHLAPHGRVMEVLSEHLCQGWLEGYLLTGRHGLFSCYEAFIHIVDSMVNQHAKWLKTTRRIAVAPADPSLNYLLTSHVWRQDHNGFSHQDPGFIDHVVNKKAEVIRVYLPPDANTLLSIDDHCLRSRDYVNVIVAGKQPAPTGYDGRGRAHCAPRHRHLGLGEHRRRRDPDVVLACAGDVPTLETLAAADLLRQHLPELKVRVVNVVDLMRLQPDDASTRTGCRDREFDALFTTDKPVIFAYHGYPVADPPADLPADQPRQPARARLQGGGHHHDAVRHGHAQRPGPLPPGHRRHRPGAGAGRRGRRAAPARWSTRGRRAAATSASTARTTPGSRTGAGCARRTRDCGGTSEREE